MALCMGPSRCCSLVRPHPGNELDMQISDEMAVELAIGDLVVVPASAGGVPHLRDRQRAA